MKGWSDLEDPTKLGERKKAAEYACGELNFDFPTVIDGMKDEVAIRWTGWPERLIVISKTGKIVYTGDQGPFAFNPSSSYKRGNRKTPGIPLEDFLSTYLKDK